MALMSGAANSGIKVVKTPAGRSNQVNETVRWKRSAIAPPARTEAPAGRADAPAGQVTFAATVTLAPTWFDPAETPGVITPFLTLYALHDALVKPMPGNAWAPGLAESWTASKDGLMYEFVLRKGVRFHNGDPLTAEDVKFSFDRYKGGGATTLKARVAAKFAQYL